MIASLALRAGSSTGIRAADTCPMRVTSLVPRTVLAAQEYGTPEVAGPTVPIFGSHVVVYTQYISDKYTGL